MGASAPWGRGIQGDLGVLLEESVGAGSEGRKDLGHESREGESPHRGVIRNESEERGKEWVNHLGVLSSSFLRAGTASAVSTGTLGILHCYPAPSRWNQVLRKQLVLAKKWSKKAA